MAGIDEIVFHQFLAWHHVYDRSTPAIAWLSDGLIHAAELLVLVGGFVLFADLRHRQILAPRHAWGGLFLGLGGFQLFDGIVDHKILRPHQIRNVDNVLPYDVVWNAAGLVLLLIGIALTVQARSECGSAVATAAD